jgi:glycosyltransferase involved in cell wall biosynthesis
MIAGKVILSLSPFPAAPLYNGAVARIHYLNKGLAETNRLIFVFRDDPACDQPGFDCRPVPNSRYRPLQIFNLFLLVRLLRFIRSEQVDLIISSHIWCGFHGLLLKLLTGELFLFDDHNVEYLRFRRMGSPLWPVVWLLEWGICRVADRVLCVSDTDRDHLVTQLRVASSKIDVIPNGVDIEACDRVPVDASRVREGLGLRTGQTVALFFGTLDYQSNVTAVENIFREIVPRLDGWGSSIKIVIAGRGGSHKWLSSLQHASERVAFVGFVEDIVAYIKSADVVVAPLTTGSGTRFKIVESVGCGRRVVSTTIGAEGLDQRAFGDSLVIRDDWGDFARAVVETAKRGPLAPSPEFVQMYDWRHIVQRLQS